MADQPDTSRSEGGYKEVPSPPAISRSGKLVSGHTMWVPEGDEEGDGGGSCSSNSGCAGAFIVLIGSIAASGAILTNFVAFLLHFVVH